MSDSPGSETFGMRLLPHERRQIERLAAARGTTMKEAILQAVARDLDAAEPSFTPRSGSVLEGLSDVIGATEGPADLSANRSHLEGYGDARPAREAGR